MIAPTKADIGRTVEYRDRSRLAAIPVQGVMTEFNDHYAFVRYGADKHGKATTFADLDWETPPRKRKRR